ncbi:rolling circle replication-associated protein [Eubacterium maltosivorans]|uniref:Replication-associated protein ORF2/G2P domain-containing protein n=1 Tax=Eubacterium maltosivorans TaxID=2041044 RepID=A0A4P9C7U7_EUBML|nr:hypothetical protein [Eubacterium maltosivorans]QCT71550.1 hypothetical protein CPZ25_009490 [Eubacterium maltosivorans]
MYEKWTVEAGNTIEVKKTYAYREWQKGKPRARKSRPTSEAQKKVNRNKQEAQIRAYINENFWEGDLHIVLPYRIPERPEERAAARAHLAKFHKDLRRHCKKAEIDYKYIAVTEVGKRGAFHHHIVLNKMDTAVIAKLWPYGTVQFNHLDNRADHKKLAHYLIKYTDYEFDHYEDRKGKRRFNTSHNLIRPEPKIQAVKAERWIREPKPQKGYYIDKESVYMGKNPFNGTPYQFYRMIRLDPVNPNEKRKVRKC